jgi:excisionase family DNA binding protein
MPHDFEFTTHRKYALTVAEAVIFTGIGRTKLYELINSGAIVPRHCGKKTLFIRSELEEFLNSLPTEKGRGKQ